MSGILTIAATPIGNAGDASARLREALVQADVIACEDTRKLQRLLGDLSLKTNARFIVYHDVNERKQSTKLLSSLLAGESVLLITDAGTPLVSDPGFALVRGAIAAGVTVGVLPGPSAALAALTLSGLPPDRFVFEGFLPKKSGARKSRLKELSTDPRTLVIYETSRNTQRTLQELTEFFDSHRQVFIARELTKVHEEQIRGELGEVLDSLGGRVLKGEVVLVIEGLTRANRLKREKT
jgi:16S rRNA (cytidine1402-2'-O)-methyltransferase